MPLYEYQCPDCQHRFERLGRYDDPAPACPECQSDQTNRLISAAAFRLKGSGWYETDFKSDKKRNLHESTHADKPADKPATAETSKTESKPASEASAKPAPSEPSSKSS